MTGLLAFVSFVLATVVFFLLAIEEVTWQAAWGWFFVALGLALMCLGGAITTVRSKA